MTLEKVLKGIEAFKADMEDLGVDVKVSAAGELGKLPREDRVTLLAMVTLQLEEGELEDVG